MELDRFFPIRHRTKTIRWRMTRPYWMESVELLEALLENIDLVPGRNFFKNGQRRLIFCWSQTGEHDKPNLLAKGFPLKRIKDRLRYRRYGVAEAVNLTKAKHRGLPVPTAHALGLRRGLIGVDFAVVIMDYLPYPSMYDLFFTAMEEDAREKLFQRAGPLIKMLYFRGANHIDFGAHSILLSREELGVDSIIDWQYANFIEQRTPKLPAALAGLFGRSVAINQNWFSVATVTEWFLELLEELEIEKSPILLDIFQRNLTERLPIRSRLNLSAESRLEY